MEKEQDIQRCGDCTYFEVFKYGALKGWGECSHPIMLRYAKSPATFQCENFSPSKQVE